MDGQLADPKDAELKALLAKFVCVRMIQMYGLDLARFQFDWTQTWAAFFMNADGTLYGRYGSRSTMGKQSARDMSAAGFKRSLEATLALHGRYVSDPDEVRAEVSGKQTQHAPQWARPERIPRLARNKRLSVPFSAFAKERNLRAHGVGCIHCHMVAPNEIMSLREAEKPVPDRLLWPYPMPYTVGLHMDSSQCATVQRVVPNSIAAKAGVETADEILIFAGQRVLSTADLQWVLHHARSGSGVAMRIRRGGETKEVTLRLPEGWRQRLGNWRFTNMGICMQIAGFNGRPARGGNKQLRIRVQRVHRKRLAGVDLRRNDIIVALDGDRSPKNLGQLARFLLAKKPGSTLEATVVRGRSAPRTIKLELK